MSAVVTHQAHPQSLVNTGKFPITDQVGALHSEHSEDLGLFQILPSDEFLTSHRTGQVKLRLQDRGMAAEPATSIPNLIQVRNIVIGIYFANFIPSGILLSSEISSGSFGRYYRSFCIKANLFIA